ncbi:MAG: CPBP family intramembrane metalloprotease [Clostridia bacterium]|nr:CPBP family intramembrane metalloprotease [Clostridia bacterium]
MDNPNKAKLHILVPSLENPTWAAAFLLLCAMLARILERFGVSFGNPTVAALIWEAVGCGIPLAVWFVTRRKTLWQDLWIRGVSPKQIPLLIWIALILPPLSLLISLPFGNMVFLDRPFALFGVFVPLSGGSFADKLLMVLAFLILPVFLEELLFRCVLPHAFSRSGPFVTAILSSALFAFLDFSGGTWLVSFVVGLALYLILYATRSLTPVLIVRLIYQIFAVFFRQELVSFYRSAGTGTIFLFILFLLFGILAFLICTCLISLNRHYAKTLTNNEEAYQNREIHTAKEWTLASLLLLRNACLDPFNWSSLVCFLVGAIAG